MLSIYVPALLYLPCKIFITLDKLISCYYITYLTVTLLFPDIVICDVYCEIVFYVNLISTIH